MDKALWKTLMLLVVREKQKNNRKIIKIEDLLVKYSRHYIKDTMNIYIYRKEIEELFYNRISELSRGSQKKRPSLRMIE